MTHIPRVVVTRAAGQASSLAHRIAAIGAVPVVVPVIATAPPLDDGAALRLAVEDLDERFDWVVLTSPTAAAVFASALGTSSCGARIAAVGPGTADAMVEHGLTVSLTPRRSMAEGLLDSMSELPPARVLLPQAAGARPVLAVGLAELGWDVTVVQAYRTMAVVPTDHERAEARSCDAIVFTSSSTVDAWMDSVAGADTPAVVVSIGPATSDTARLRGLAVTVEADPHTLDGVIAALELVLTR